MPPPWMMQPPPSKKKVNDNNGNGDYRVTTQTSPPAVTPVAPVPSVASSFQEDPGVLQSEITKTKESDVSMSVGDPDVATAVVKDWLEQEAPPAPEPTEVVAPEAEADGGKKKKKKK